MAITLTNKYNLPPQIVKACLSDNHKVGGDISCSQLIESPRVILLKRNNDYEEDVSDRLYMLMGTAIHSILELSNTSSTEKRAFLSVIDVLQNKLKQVSDEKKSEGIKRVMDYLVRFMNAMYPETESRFLYEVTQRFQFEDKVLYGTPDLFDKETGILYDYKYCTTFMYTNPESQLKWEAQMNVYAWLLTQAGFEVKELRIVAFFRDWSGQPFQKKKDYPDSQVKEINIKLRTAAEMTNYITKRMKMHADAEETGMLPLCSGRERWASADMYAVKTPKAKKALKVDIDKAMCEKFMIDYNHKFQDMFIEFRPGMSNKCERFCQVKSFCDQYKTEMEMRVKQSNDE